MTGPTGSAAGSGAAWCAGSLGAFGFGAAPEQEPATEAGSSARGSSTGGWGGRRADRKGGIDCPRGPAASRGGWGPDRASAGTSRSMLLRDLRPDQLGVL
eukprot:8798709-Alexandrium_andersonii.AAC.1